MSIISAVINRTDGRKEAKRFVKFSIVGGFGAIIDFTLLNILIFGFGLNTDLGKIIANIISTSTAILSNFTWNRLWTFPESRTRKRSTQLVQFTVVNLIGLGINTFIFAVADNLIYNPLFLTPFFQNNGEFIFAPLTPETLAIQMAKATAIGLVLFWNFGANRLWTYRGL
ncbi:MAG: GtrA family protein [Chloroflexota bacterium]